MVIRGLSSEMVDGLLVALVSENALAITADSKFKVVGLRTEN